METVATLVAKPIPPRAWTAEEFLEKPMPQKVPLVDGLIHRRDLVALGARRRNGKTSFITDLAVQLATGASDFLGYRIAEPRRTLLLILEDDPGEFQEKLKRVIGNRDTQGRIRVATREDFFAGDVQINIDDPKFLAAVHRLATEHQPDLIVLDNLAQVVRADYNDPKKIHKVAKLCFDLGREHDAAVIVPAHPKKEDLQNPIDLVHSPTSFFESIMGSSHFVNSMGSLWGLQRDANDVTAFVGGRQRGDGQQSASYLEMDEDGHFALASNLATVLPLVLNTDQRLQAWALLPDAPVTFGYREAETLVQTALRSSSTFSRWMRECRRLGVILEARDSKLMKATGHAASPASVGKLKKV
ncbi:MAG: AAA family ATPase [Candidatus Solibacter sp.]